jgi:hypothetical protein
VAACLAALSGCEDGPVDPDVGIDASEDAPVMRLDTGPPCTGDAECDDGIACTMDTCDPTGRFCRNSLDNAFCDDGIFCNGEEYCDPVFNCLAGDRRSCDDEDVCTVDTCNEADRVCDRRPRDLDRDGDTDFFCAGGGDCDDRDATRSSLSPEICEDGIDNDCDGSLDEPDCGTPENDRCDDPRDVSAGGSFLFNTRGSVADYALSCAFDNRGDMVAQFTIPAGGGPRDVRIRGEGDLFSVALSLRSDCTDAASQLECINGWPAVVRARSLPEGTYFIVIAGLYGVGEIVLNVEFDDPTPPAENDTCATPTEIPAGGGDFTGSFVDVEDETTTTCGTSGSPDLFYHLHLDAPADVRVSAGSTTGESMVWSFRSTCESPSTDRQCAYGAPATGRVHQLPAGDHYLVLEGPSYVEVDFTLSVEVLGASPPVLGDRCDAPIPITPGVTYAGTLLDKQHDYEVSCGYHYRDAIHTFTLATAADVTIDLDGGGTYMNLAVRSTCDAEGTQLRCDAGSPARARMRGLAAGTYFVIVEGSSAGSYTLDLEITTPPSVPIETTGNDVCAGAVVVPEGGGLYTGSTITAINDYTTATTSCGFMATSKDVVFRLDLTARSRVVATTDGSSFDTVLYYIVGACPGPEAACDDNSGEGTRSLLDRNLEPGTYYFIVDGWGSSSAGSYVFEITTTPL